MFNLTPNKTFIDAAQHCEDNDLIGKDPETLTQPEKLLLSCVVAYDDMLRSVTQDDTSIYNFIDLQSE